MMTAISRTDLARNTRDILEQVRQGEPLVVQSHGENQVVLLDALDYQLLRAVASYALRLLPSQAEEGATAVMRLYLDEQVSLSKAAEQLQVSRFELMERFERLGVPLRVGSATLEEAKDEVAAAANVKPMQQ
jgi:prevent-host-death family protein